MISTWLPSGCVVLAVLMAGTTAAQDLSGECIVLVHGLGRTSLSMKRIQWMLQSAGYQVVNVSYPSRRFTVERLSEDYLAKAIETKVPIGTAKVHFVTHSMGGILVREYMAHHPMTNLGRVVMLAPPNHGSLVVDSMRRRALSRWILGPGGCELGTAADDLPQRLGPVDFPLGVIAGDVSLNPFFSNVLKDTNDGKVTLESAKIAGMGDFVVVHSSHTWLMWRAQTMRHIRTFLRQGSFEKTRT
jgi:triacylglycerol lipase